MFRDEEDGGRGHSCSHSSGGVVFLILELKFWTYVSTDEHKDKDCG